MIATIRVISNQAEIEAAKKQNESVLTEINTHGEETTLKGEEIPVPDPVYSESKLWLDSSKVKYALITLEGHIHLVHEDGQFLLIYDEKTIDALNKRFAE